MPTPYPQIVKHPETFSKMARLNAKYLGIPVKVAIDTKNFDRPTDIYLAYCKRHKVYYLDYLHGYDEVVFCPLCLKEETQKIIKMI